MRRWWKTILRLQTDLIEIIWTSLSLLAFLATSLVFRERTKDRFWARASAKPYKYIKQAGVNLRRATIQWLTTIFAALPGVIALFRAPTTVGPRPLAALIQVMLLTVIPFLAAINAVLDLRYDHSEEQSNS